MLRGFLPLYLPLENARRSSKRPRKAFHFPPSTPFSLPRPWTILKNLETSSLNKLSRLNVLFGRNSRRFNSSVLSLRKPTNLPEPLLYFQTFHCDTSVRWRSSCLESTLFPLSSLRPWLMDWEILYVMWQTVNQSLAPWFIKHHQLWDWSLKSRTSIRSYSSGKSGIFGSTSKPRCSGWSLQKLDCCLSTMSHMRGISSVLLLLSLKMTV